jgi:hypothetical protein
MLLKNARISSQKLLLRYLIFHKISEKVGGGGLQPL